MTVWDDRMGPKRRPDLALSRRNLKLIAERTGWPDGALQACWDLENRYPGWSVSWLHENTISGFERPAGFWGVYRRQAHQAEAFRVTVQELALVMAEEIPPHDYSLQGCGWCVDHDFRHRPKL